MSQFIQAAFNHSQEAINNLKVALSQVPSAAVSKADERQYDEAGKLELACLQEQLGQAIALKKLIGKYLLDCDE